MRKGEIIIFLCATNVVVVVVHVVVLFIRLWLVLSVFSCERKLITEAFKTSGEVCRRRSHINNKVRWPFSDRFECTMLCDTLGVRLHSCAKLISRLPKLLYISLIAPRRYSVSVPLLFFSLLFYLQLLFFFLFSCLACDISLTCSLLMCLIVN